MCEESQLLVLFPATPWRRTVGMSRSVALVSEKQLRVASATNTDERGMIPGTGTFLNLYSENMICGPQIQIAPHETRLTSPPSAPARYKPFFDLFSHDVHESVHRDTTMKITNKMHYID